MVLAAYSGIFYDGIWSGPLCPVNKQEKILLREPDVKAQSNFQTKNAQALPSAHTQWATPESRFRTGELAPPSITDNTTRHLEMDPEGHTMSLPKK